MSKAKTLLELINLLGKEANKETPSDSEDKPIEVTVTTVEEFIAALENLSGKTEITLEDNLNLETPLEVPVGAEVILNLSNNSVTVDKDIYAFENSGNMTINGGEITGKGVLNNPGGTLVIDNDAHITSTNEDGGTAAIQNEGDLVIKSGTFAVTHVGSTKDPKGVAIVRNNGTMVVEQGTFESPNKRAYAIISNGEITLTNSGETIINGVHGGIAADSGKVTINGGSYNSDEFYAIYASIDAVTDMDDEEQIPNIVINDGTFNGKRYSIWIGSDDNPIVKGYIRIYGGTFLKPVNAEAKVLEGNGIFIYGGKFASPVGAQYLAEGYGCTPEPDDDGFYHVVPTN